MIDEFDAKKAIYDQDCQFYRYQDGLMWSRFQTAALIEGAMLYGLYQVHQFSLPRPEKLIIVLVGTVFVLIICTLALKDQSDASGHFDRFKKFEDEFNRFTPRPWPKHLKGILLLRAMAGIITALNVWLTIRTAISTL
jgi:MFS superfamily sulfate permease-like transporter